MTSPRRHVSFVFVGDTFASPAAIVEHIRSYWTKQQGVLREVTDFPNCTLTLSLKNLPNNHTTEDSLLHVSFNVFTTPPRVLITGVDVVVLLFSPAHPLSFRHVWEVWWPLFAHVRHIPHLLVANHMELLTMPEVREMMRKHGVDSISLDEVRTIMRAASPLVLDDVYPVSLQVEGAFSSGRFSSIARLCDGLLRRCSALTDSTNATPPVSLPERWEAALDEALALQLEAQLLPEWSRFPSSTSDLVFYANRRTGEVTTTRPHSMRTAERSANAPETFERRRAMARAERMRPPAALPTGTAVALERGVPKAYMDELEADVAALRARRGRLCAAQEEVRARRAAIDALRADGAKRRAALEASAPEVDALRAKCDAAQAVHAALEQRLAALAASDPAALEAIATETAETKERYLRLWEANRGRRGEVAATRAALSESMERLAHLGKRMRHEVDGPLKMLRRQIISHHLALATEEVECFAMTEARRLGVRPEVKRIDTKEKGDAREDEARMVREALLQAMRSLLLNVIEPLLVAADSLRKVVPRVHERSHGTNSRNTLHLLKEECQGRLRLEAAQLLDYINHFLDALLMPTQLMGRCIAEHLNTFLS